MSDLLNALPDYRVDEYHAQGAICERDGEGPLYVFWLLSGSVVTYQNLPEHGRRVIDFLRPGQLFLGHEVPPSRIPLSGVRTRGPCSVARLTQECFLAHCQADPQLMALYMAQSQERLDRVERKLASFTIHDVATRVLHALADLVGFPEATPWETGWQIRITRRELAQLVGCSREMAGRALKELEEQGRVELSGRKVFLPQAFISSPP
ncbi:MAG: helix-turn-helix domain-containing protein [Halorhodospira sp.]